MNIKLVQALNIKKHLLSLFKRQLDAYTALDGLRALAVLWVTSLHIFIYIGNQYTTRGFLPIVLGSKFIFAGDLGVDLFFVLSGFLIADIIIRSLAKFNYFSFLYSRFMRIAPVYYMIILLNAVGASSDADATSCQQYWWTNILFVNNFLGPQVGTQQPGCLGQSWSIAVEFQFYVLSPFIVLLLVSASWAEWKRVFALPPFVLYILYKLKAILCCQCRINQDNDEEYYHIQTSASSASSASSSSGISSAPAGIMSSSQYQEPLLVSSSSAASAPGFLSPTFKSIPERLQHNLMYKLGFLFTISVISLLIQAGIYKHYYPINGMAGIAWFCAQIYVRFYTRITCYLCGMLAALLIQANKEVSPYSDAEKQLNARHSALEHIGIDSDATSSRVALDLNESSSSSLCASISSQIASATSQDKLRWFGHCVAFIVMVLSAYYGPGTATFYEVNPDLFNKTTIFLCFIIRPAYGLSMAWFIYFMLTKRARALNWFLSWNFWVPLARLSFTVYLLQFVGIYYYQELRVHQTWIPVFDLHWSLSQALFYGSIYALIIQISLFIVALPFHVLIEKPFMMLR